MTAWEYAQLVEGETIANEHKLIWDGPEHGGQDQAGEDDTVAALNSIGQAGWELVSVDTKHHLPDLEGNRWTNTVYTFKREASPDAVMPVFY